MVFGKEIALPIEAYTPNAPSDKEFNAPEFVKSIKERLKQSHSIAMINLQKAMDHEQKSYLNRLKPNKYKLKDVVWYWQPTFKKGECPKILSFWTGPYFIIEVISDVVYRIQQSARGKSSIVHHNQLKPCHARDTLDTSWMKNCRARYSKKSYLNYPQKTLLGNVASLHRLLRLRNLKKIRENLIKLVKNLVFP